MPEDLINKIIEKTSALTDLANELKEAGADKMSSLIEEVAGSTNIINQSGFVLKDIDVRLGLPPEIVGVFLFDHDVPDEQWEKLFAETEDKTVLNSLLKALFKAQQLSKNMKLGNFVLSSVSVLFTVPPGIGIKFKLNP
jgi:hypothetical protein